MKLLLPGSLEEAEAVGANFGANAWPGVLPSHPVYPLDWSAFWPHVAAGHVSGPVLWLVNVQCAFLLLLLVTGQAGNKFPRHFVGVNVSEK